MAVGGRGVGRVVRRLLVTTGALTLAVTLVAGTATAGPAALVSETGGPANAAHDGREKVIGPSNAGRLAQVWADDRFTGTRTPPTVVGGTVYRVLSTSSALATSPFEVRSARTGELLWSLRLPDRAFYEQGVTVDLARGLAVVSFKGSGRSDGVLAVDLVQRRIAWTSYLPADRVWWASDPRGAGPAVVDGQRVYVSGADNAVNAFRLSDGALLWTLPLAANGERWLHRHYGTAAAGGIVYVGTSEGLQAHAAADGRRLWSAPAAGHPVVAGGRVLVARDRGVTAVSAAGCGAATCPVLWQRELGPSKTFAPGALPTAPRIGGATSSTLFATYVTGEGGIDERGVVVRLSAKTGAVLWSAVTLEDPGFPYRAGATVWLIANPGPDGAGERSVVAFPATGRSTAPLVSVPMPRGSGFYGGVMVSGGTVVVQNMAGPLLAYRVPGT